MKINEWVKIGETTKDTSFTQPGLYAKYSVMEMIQTNGDRKYKEVLICTWTNQCEVTSQKQTL